MTCRECGACGSCRCEVAHGVGWHLTELIPKWAKLLLVPGDCNCELEAEELDRLGPDGCELRFDWIVDRMTRKTPKLTQPLTRPEIAKLLRRAIAAARRELGPPMPRVDPSSRTPYNIGVISAVE